MHIALDRAPGGDDTGAAADDYATATPPSTFPARSSARFASGDIDALVTSASGDAAAAVKV